MRRRRDAPTSLTLRDLICAVAQSRSRDEFQVIHDALG